MLLEEPFVSGRLLLENTPSGNAPVVAESVPVLFTVLAVAFVLASFLFLPRLVSLAPLLFDSLFRARGSVSLENSVRYSNDRRLLATLLLLPSSLLIYRYRLWDADFVQGMSEGWRLVVIIGVFAVFFLFLLRVLVAGSLTDLPQPLLSITIHGAELEEVKDSVVGAYTF